MSTPPDPLVAALRAALDDERGGAATSAAMSDADDAALIARAITRATSTLSATDPSAAASNDAKTPARGAVERSPRTRSSFVRLTLPLAAVCAASIALASVYVATRSVPPPVSPNDLPETSSSLDAPPRVQRDLNLPGEIPSISVTDLPSAKPSAAVTSARTWSPPTTDSVVTAAELFRDANAERRSGNVEKSIDLYRALQKQFPDASETRASRVTLGRLLLDRQSDATGALAQFDAYLSGHGADGALSEEARLGRALALQRLGQASAEKQAWQDLLVQHPQSLHASRAKERLRVLEGGAP